MTTVSALLAIPEEYFDDADLDLWALVEPAAREAMAEACNEAGVGIEDVWPPGAGPCRPMRCQMARAPEFYEGAHGELVAAPPGRMALVKFSVALP